jgi:hypothetical protein
LADMSYMGKSYMDKSYMGKSYMGKMRAPPAARLRPVCRGGAPAFEPRGENEGNAGPRGRRLSVARSTL